MNDFLRKIKLIDTFTIDLPVQKADFVPTLQNNIEPGGDLFEAFSSSKKIYKGKVDLQGFEIKRRRMLFDTRQNFAVARGRFSQLGDQLRIETEVNGFHWILIFFLIFILLIYVSAFAVIFLTGGEDDGNVPIFIIPFMLLHGVFMLAIPYFILRNSVRWMKHDLQRELFFLTRDQG